MSMKILAGFAAALVVTTVGVFAANTGSVSSLFDSDGTSPCGTQSSCPFSVPLAPNACSGENADAAVTPASEEALGACAGGTTSASTTPATSACCEKSAKKVCCDDE